MDGPLAMKLSMSAIFYPRWTATEVKICYNTSNPKLAGFLNPMTFHFDSVIHIQTKPDTYDYVHESGNMP